MPKKKKYDKVVLVNEKNKREEFEVIMTFEVENNEYAALLPVKDEDAEVLLFRLEKDGHDATFLPIEDKEEFDIVAESYYEFLEQ